MARFRWVLTGLLLVLGLLAPTSSLHLFVSSSLAATWYVHAQNGSDSNAGTMAAPFATLDKLQDVMVSGDEALLAGTFRESITFTGLTGCSWRQWQGQAKYVVRGDTVVTGWTSLGGGVYQKDIGAVNVKSVVVNWDTSVNANGLHYGHLSAGTFGSLSAGQWGYSSPNLQVRLTGDVNPATKTVAWCVGGVNGFHLATVTNCVVDDFRAALWVDSNPGLGYGFLCSGNGNTLRIDRIDDCGYHHAGFVGGSCSYNTFEPSRMGEGVCAGTNTGGIHLVFYTNQNSQTGCVGRDLTLVCSPFLKEDGATGTHSGTIGGVYSHTDGARVFDGVTWERIRVTYPYTVGIYSQGIDAAHTTRPAAADEEDWNNYGVKAIECRIDGAGAPGLNLNGSMADVRCSYRFSGSATKSQTTGVFYSSASGVAKTRLLDACEVVCNLGDSGATAANVFRPWTNDRWVLLNCSFVEHGSGTNERRIFYPVASSASIKAKQCIFAYANSTATFRRFMYTDSWDNSAVSNGVESLAPRVFEDCAYIRIVDTVWSTRADYNTQAEWISAAMDTGGQASTTSPFEEPTFSARLKRSHALWTYRDTGTSGHTSVGINRKLWTGTLGCYQLNASATATWSALTASPPPTRNDPAMWVSFYTGATTNPYGIRQDLFDDPEGYLAALFDKAGAAGLKTVIFHVPWGHNTTYYYKAGGANDLPRHVRDAIECNLTKWKAASGVQHVGVYGGAVWGTAQAGASPAKPTMHPEWEDWAVAELLESWADIGVDIYVYDAVANAGNDQYGDAVDDTFDTLGGFTYQVCGLVPWGEALPVDDPVTTTEFDTAAAARAEFVVLEGLYQDAVDAGAGSADYVGVLDGTLPSTRRGFRWLYYASEFTRAAAQDRVDQGYIVDVWNDVDAGDMAWVAVQRPTALEGPVARAPRLQNRGRLGDRARLN